MIYNLQEIMDILKPYYRKDYKIIRHNQVFDPDSFFIFFKDMMDIADKLKDFRIVVSLWRRNGLGEFNNLMQQMINFIFVELWKNYAGD